MSALAYKVSYNHNYKGFRRDSYPPLKAVVAEDMKVFVSVVNLLFWSGELRYRQMLGLDFETVWPWGFRWYEYLDSHIYNQVSAMVGMLDYADDDRITGEE